LSKAERDCRMLKFWLIETRAVVEWVLMPVVELKNKRTPLIHRQDLEAQNRPLSLTPGISRTDA